MDEVVPDGPRRREVVTGKEIPSTAEDWIALGVKKGYLRFDESKITYIHSGKTYRRTDPEERARASYLQPNPRAQRGVKRRAV